MRKKNVRKLSKKGVALLAAAAMSAMVLCQTGYSVLAEETQITVEMSSLIPDNITIEEPTALSNVALPSSEYGTLSWADSSFVPQERVQSCTVVFKSSGKTDLSHISGWDGESQSFTGKVKVVVSSIGAEPTAAPTPTAALETTPTDIPTETPTDVPTETPGVSETPEMTPTETPETTPTDIPTETPTDVPTETPGVSETPEMTPTETPETTPTDVPTETPTDVPTETPSVSETPEMTPTETPETTPTDVPIETPTDIPTETPSVSETPEVPPTEIPEAAPTETPEMTPTDVPTETPETTPTDIPTETPTDVPTETPGVSETPELPPTQVPEQPAPTETPDIFDAPAVPEQEERPNTVADNLTPEEQAARAAENHTSNGITVHGDIPWYVQFRAYGGEEYSFRNAEGADIFKSYEFQLWDLKNNTEYQIPDGQYVSVTVPVKAGYEYSIEHILANGATETIIPSVEGTTMVFSTHSFSPFGIAGSKPIVGGEVGDKGYENVAPSAPDATATPTPNAPTAAPVPTKAPEATKAPETGTQGTTPVVPGGNTVTGENNQTSGQDSTAGSADNQTGNDSNSSDNKVSSNTGSSTSNNNAGNRTQSPRAVKTGDNTMILPFVILLAAAVIAVIVVVVMKKKK